MDLEFVFETAFRQLIMSSAPTSLIFSMSRFKCSRKTAWIVFTVITAFGTIVNTLIVLFAGSERMKQAYAAVLLAPTVIFLLFAARDTFSQFLFNFFTAINMVYFVSILSHFILGGVLAKNDKLIWQDALIRAVLYGIILFFFIYRARGAYRFLADHMKKSGWRVMCIIPLLFFGLVMFMGLYPHVRTDNLLAVTFLYVILGFVYYIIYQVFNSTYHLLQVTGDNDALKIQVQAMERQSETVRRSEEQARIYRHDMRHYIADVRMLLLEGKSEEALEVLSGFNDKSIRTELSVYCENAVVNAILSLYLQQAAERGIVIQADCDIPETLPVESAELAAVFGNAIENAVIACDKLPEGADKRILVRCISKPQLVLEVINTCPEEVLFDRRNRPVTDSDGHGIGTRSIIAFTEKYDGVLDYQVCGGMFRMRLMVGNQDAGKSKIEG